MRKALIIGYHFPPLASAGVYRTLRIVRYLDRFGWCPVVLTVRGGFDRTYDPELMELVSPRVLIERTPWIDPRMRRRRGRHPGEAPARAERTRPPAETGGAGPHSSRRTGTSMLRALLREELLIPDDVIGWVPYAVRAGRRLAEEEGIELVYATGGPFSAYIAACLIGRSSGLPLVLDYRDPWAFNVRMVGLTGLGALRKQLELQMERKILRAAARVIVNTPTALDAFRRTFGGIPAERFACVPNSYDGDDFSNSTKGKPTRFTITYLGATRLASPAPFLRGLRSALDELPSAKGAILFRCFGPVDPDIRLLIERLGLSDIVELRELIPHSQAIEEMRHSAVLLLLLNDFEGAGLLVPAKLYEYLAAGRPILGIVPEGPAADIIRRAGAGAVVHPEDGNGVRTEIMRLYQRFERGENSFVPDSSVVRRYEAREMVRQIAGIFDDAVGELAGVR